PCELRHDADLLQSRQGDRCRSPGADHPGHAAPDALQGVRKLDLNHWRPAMRAVIYARYSTDLQREASIEDQVRICRQRMDREGWTLVATYSDAASSGASRLRPGYQKLLEDARAGAFDIVVAEALDRLSRDQEDVAALYKQLRFRGVRILTVAEG